MRSIAVFFDASGFQAEPFDDPAYASAYAELGKNVVAQGSRFFIVRGQASYRGGNAFTHGWEWRDGEWIEQGDGVDVDRVYNKGITFRPDDAADVVTTPAFDALCGDKERIYHLFPELFPKTTTVWNAAERDRAIDALLSEIVVLKPSDGWGGRDVFIGSKEEAKRQASAYPLLVQQFIDMRGGAPGVAEGAHDLRAIVGDGRILMTFVKTPPLGKLIANVSKGGRMIVIPPSNRPPEVLALVPPVDAVLSSYGKRLYSIDCARDKSGQWLLIEINSHPGLMTLEEAGVLVDDCFRDWAAFLLSD